MPRKQPDYHDLKIFRTSYTNVQQLIKCGVFNPVRSSLTKEIGVQASETYELTPGTPILLHNDHRINIANTAICGQFAHLPSPAHQALVAASDAYFAPPGLENLLALMQSAHSNPVRLAELLEWTVTQGGKLSRQAALITPSRQFSSEWLPAGTLLQRTSSGDYYLSLAFQTRFERCTQATAPCHIGLDVGLDPVVALRHQDGATHLIRPAELYLPNPKTLSYKARLLLEDLIYASGRMDAERIIRYLIHHASRVTAEKIRMQGLNRDYVLRSRDRAVQDFHYSWLSQYLYAASIPFKRVAAGYTSTECPRCRHTSPDNRQRNIFCCVQCGYTENAHSVAADNILTRGLRYV